MIPSSVLNHRPQARLRAAALLLGLALFGACTEAGSLGSGTGTTAAGGSSGTGTHPSGGVVLTVSAAASPATVAGLGPTAGNAYVVLSLTLENTGAQVPLSTNIVLFAVDTSQSLVILPSAEQPSAACSPMVSVASGGQIQCQIAFLVPTGQTATTLTYDDQRGDTASAAIPAIVMTSPGACQTVTGWVSQMPADNACLECLAAAEGGADGGAQGACGTEKASYLGTCEGSKGCTTFATLCSCEAAADDVACQTLFSDYMGCLGSSCASMCM